MRNAPGYEEAVQAARESVAPPKLVEFKPEFATKSLRLIPQPGNE